MAAHQPLPQLEISSLSLEWSTPQTPPGSPSRRSPSPLTFHFRHGAGDNTNNNSHFSDRTFNSQSSILSLSGVVGAGIGNNATRGAGSGSESYTGSSVSDCGLGLTGTLSNDGQHDMKSCSLGSLATTSQRRGTKQRNKHQYSDHDARRNNSIGNDSNNHLDEVICVDPYKILGLERGHGTTLDDIKKAYRRLALLSHPRRRRGGLSSFPMHHSNHQEQHLKPSLSTDDNSSSAHSHCGGVSLSSQFISNNNETTIIPPIREEDIREWHFITVAASYETLSVPEHRKEYDAICNSGQDVIFRNDISHKKFQKTKGFWMTLRKRLDVNDSFDAGSQNHGISCCGAEGGGNPISTNNSNDCRLIDVCGVGVGDNTPNTLASPTNNIQSKLQRSRSSTRFKSLSSKHPSSSLQKPMLLRDNSLRQKSTGTVESVATEESSVADYDIREETSYLFGGPLSSLYKARQYEPFSDAFELFRHEFGSDIFRSRSCFDDDDDDMMDTTTTTATTSCVTTDTKRKTLAAAVADDNAIAQQWLSGGSIGSDGKIWNNDIDTSQEMISDLHTPIQRSVTTRMAPKMIETTRISQEKPALVYPVLPNIPQHVLQSYGILDGCMRNPVSATTTTKTFNKHSKSNPYHLRDKNSSSNITTEVRRETKNGISSEITTATKRVGNMRVVRTKIVTIDDRTGKRKTVTSVNREMVQDEVLEEEKVILESLEADNKNSGMNILDLVHCCSFSLHPHPILEGVPQPQLPPPPPPALTRAPSQQSNPSQSQLPSPPAENIAPLPSPSTIMSTKKFEDKKALKLRMKKLFLAQQHKSRGLSQ